MMDGLTDSISGIFRKNKSGYWGAGWLGFNKKKQAYFYRYSSGVWSILCFWCCDTIYSH
jgi:hypothetical protein